MRLVIAERFHNIARQWSLFACETHEQRGNARIAWVNARAPAPSNLGPAAFGGNSAICCKCSFQALIFLV